MTFTIEKNIPLAKPGAGGRPKTEFVLALESLEIGDSFLADHKKVNFNQIQYTAQRLGRRFARRAESDVHRITRIS